MRSSSPETLLAEALAAVSRERVSDLALALCATASPTGDTQAVTHQYGDVLSSLGMEVRYHDRFPATPVAIAELPGTDNRPTLILNGHLDTVPIPHAPACREDGRVFGRGSIDMKGPLAAAAEAVRAAREAGLTWEGRLVISAHGLHEAPGGHAEDLIAALEDGAIRGDAALVLEIGHDALPLAGLGSGIYRIHFRRDAPVDHELRTPTGTPNPAHAAADAVQLLEGFARELAARPWELAGPESLFIGQVHCGDFFNRHPNHAWIEGTRRYAPEGSAEAAQRELEELLAPVAAAHGLELVVEFEKVRDGFRVSGDHPLAAAIQAACRQERGAELPITGIRIVADAPVFQKVAGIPCLYHGLEGLGAHGDVESVAEAELERGARTYLRIISAYLGVSA